MNDTIGPVCKILIVGYHQQGQSFFLTQTLKQLEHVLRVITVQITGWFVSHNDGGIVDQRPGYCHPLFLTTRDAGSPFFRELIDLQNGKGEVRVNLLGLHDVNRERGPKIDQSSLGRYLAELVWFPPGLMDPDIRWEETNNTNELMATISKGDQKVSGIFYFDDEGWIRSIHVNRFMGERSEKFIGEAGDYKNFNGWWIPSEMNGYWDLSSGKFQYFNAQITHYSIRSGHE